MCVHLQSARVVSRHKRVRSSMVTTPTCVNTHSRSACVKGAESKGKEPRKVSASLSRGVPHRRVKMLRPKKKILTTKEMSVGTAGRGCRQEGGLRISPPSEERSPPSPTLRASRRTCWFPCCSLCAGGTGHRVVNVKPNTPSKG